MSEQMPEATFDQLASEADALAEAGQEAPALDEFGDGDDNAGEEVPEADLPDDSEG